MRFRLLTILAIAILLAACKSPPPTGGLQGTPAPGAAFRVALQVDPNPPKNDKDTTFRVVLKDFAGKPVEGATVTADLVMPEMAMGENKVQLADRGNGAYEGLGRFNMGGKWEVVVTAFKAGATAKSTFDVTVVL